MQIVVYSNTSGEIRRRCNCPPELATAQCGPGDAWVEAWGVEINDSLHRVDLTVWPHAVIEKLAVPFLIDREVISADGVDSATISDIPAGAVVLFEGALHEADGAFEFSADLPGVYSLVLRHPLHLDTTVTVTAE